MPGLVVNYKPVETIALTLPHALAAPLTSKFGLHAMVRVCAPDATLESVIVAS